MDQTEQQQQSFPAQDSAQRVTTAAAATDSGNKRRAKIILEPGHSPLDWAQKQQSTPHPVHHTTN